MFVADWMTKKVVTVDPDDPVSVALSLMREGGIKHLPAVKGGRIRGILSDRDIKEFSPSKATSLDIYEMHYLIAKTKVRQLMKSPVVTTTPDTPVEEAAMTMFDRQIGCLPVLDGGALAGIISDRDIYRVLVDITGVRHGGHRIYLTLEDRPGSIREVTDLVRTHGFHLTSILSSYEGVKKGFRDVVIRTDEGGDHAALRAALEKSYRGLRM